MSCSAIQHIYICMYLKQVILSCACSLWMYWDDKRKLTCCTCIHWQLYFIGAFNEFVVKQNCFQCFYWESSILGLFPCHQWETEPLTFLFNSLNFIREMGRLVWIIPRLFLQVQHSQFRLRGVGKFSRLAAAARCPPGQWDLSPYDGLSPAGSCQRSQLPTLSGLACAGQGEKLHLV